jgi:hypothetical protein
VRGPGDDSPARGRGRDVTRQLTDTAHGVERTGVRFVLTNNADPGRTAEYKGWYDNFGAGVTRPGFLADALRFENPSAAGNEDDPRYAAVYDIAAPDPATAWSDTERSGDYPTYLFEDPRSALVAPVLRASYALDWSKATPRRGTLTGATIVLLDGARDASRELWAAQALETGVFYGASGFRILDGDPDPPDRLEILETDQPDPSTAYLRLLELLGAPPPPTGGRQRYLGSFRLDSVFPSTLLAV